MHRFKLFDDQAQFNQAGKEMNERHRYKYGSVSLTTAMLQIAIAISDARDPEEVKSSVLLFIKNAGGTQYSYSAVIKDYETIFVELYSEVMKILAD